MKIRPDVVELGEQERVYIASAMGQKKGPKGSWLADGAPLATRETIEEFLKLAIEWAIANPHSLVGLNKGKGP